VQPCSLKNFIQDFYNLLVILKHTTYRNKIPFEIEVLEMDKKQQKIYDAIYSQ